MIQRISLAPKGSGGPDHCLAGAELNMKSFLESQYIPTEEFLSLQRVPITDDGKRKKRNSLQLV